MHGIELILTLLVAVAVLATVSERFTIPYPILLVLGGLALGFLPGLPLIELDPEAVFVLFLPPILFSAAFSTSWRDFRANLRPISLLAVGLVLVTVGVVAVVAHVIVPDLSWPVAFVLGAIVSPPDAVATMAIVQRLGVPHRLVTILEGESLVNDATALVAYRFAVAAVVTGSFSLWDASVQFVIVVVVGVAVGVAIGAAVIWLLGRLDDPLVETMVTMLAPVAAYLSAEALGGSGVLATVVAGLMVGRMAAVAMTPASRLRAGAVWEMLTFVINGLAFILIGLQLPTILDGLGGRSIGQVLWYAVAVSAAAIVVRIAWVYAATYIPRIVVPGLAMSDPAPSWRYPALLGWTGLRGVMTVGAALAMPRLTEAGEPFPGRDLVLFLAFCVILATLVGQGLTLPIVIRWLGLGSGSTRDREEVLARREAATAAIGRLDELAEEDWAARDMVDTMRAHYQHRLEHLPESLNRADWDHEHADAHERLRQAVLAAERNAIIELRDRGEIGDDVLRRVEYDLDLSEISSVE